MQFIELQDRDISEVLFISISLEFRTSLKKRGMLNIMKIIYLPGYCIEVMLVVVFVHFPIKLCRVNH